MQGTGSSTGRLFQMDRPINTGHRDAVCERVDIGKECRLLGKERDYRRFEYCALRFEHQKYRLRESNTILYR